MMLILDHPSGCDVATRSAHNGLPSDAGVAATGTCKELQVGTDHNRDNRSVIHVTRSAKFRQSGERRLAAANRLGRTFTYAGSLAMSR